MRKLEWNRLALFFGGALLLAACGSAPAPTVAPTATPEPPPPTLEVVTPTAESELPAATPAPATLTVNVGVDPYFRPFIFLDDAGRLAGFDIDLLNALSAAGDFEVAYLTVPFDEIFTGLEEGRFDAAISAITVTDERDKRVDFTTPYFRPGQAPVSYFSSGQGLAVAAQSSTIGSRDDLIEGVTVGVKRGTTGAAFVANETTATPAVFEEAEPALQALMSGDVDAVVLDIAIITEFIKAVPGAIKLTGGLLTEEEYAIAVSQDRPDVLARLNEALTVIQEDGSYDRLFAKWFGAP